MKETVACIRARNEFCTRRIEKDFIAGLRETRLEENTQNDENDDEDEDDESDVEDGEPQSILNTNFKVFCVSAKQYLKMTGNHDEEEQIFKDSQDTQIPQLKEFVQNISSERQNHAAVSLIRSIRILARDIYHYTEDSAGEHMHMQKKANTDVQIEKLETKLKQVLNDMLENIRKMFDRLVGKLAHGADLAVETADETTLNWGSKLKTQHVVLKNDLFIRRFARASRIRAASKSFDQETSNSTFRVFPGGYSWNTYQTTCQGNGIYHPRKKPEINFNGDLAEPMYSSIKVAWDDTFNHKLGSYLVDYRRTVVTLLMHFAEGLREAVNLPATPEIVTYRNCGGQLCACSDKLFGSLNTISGLIKQRQRTIIPILIEKVEVRMQPAYNSCKVEVGRGMFDRMKTNMMNHVFQNKDTMFHEAEAAMTDDLEALVDQISVGLQEGLDVLLIDLRHKSWWEPPSNTDFVAGYKTEALSIKEEIEQIYTDAGIAEHILPSASLLAASYAPPGSDPTKEN